MSRFVLERDCCSTHRCQRPATVSPTALSSFEGYRLPGESLGVASARLLGLDASGLQNALGISLGQAARTQQANVEQVLLKRLQPALAARAGVFSAKLAESGISGPTEAFEGRFGLESLYLPFDDQAILDGFGRNFLFSKTGLKKYPVCPCSHAPMDALLDLVTRHDLKPEQIHRSWHSSACAIRWHRLF